MAQSDKRIEMTGDRKTEHKSFIFPSKKNISKVSHAIRRNLNRNIVSQDQITGICFWMYLNAMFIEA